MKSPKLITCVLLATLVAACVAHPRVPECRGPLTPINVRGASHGH